ncbi:MAG: ComF family protein, partial [Deltaproteobacteria bacterium]|nr:ComF family protein [Deltaproteobacteria bacterium]
EACGPAYRGRVDLVVPVPLHRTRLVERGFDQAVLIARPLARALARPLVARALSRIRATAPQSSLDARARAENVAGAFVPTSSGRRALPGRRVLLVDDVRTTGATLDECARVARDAGAIEVLALALAAA